MPTILSLFDESGIWSHPFVQAGYDVYQFDLNTGFEIRDFSVGWFIENWNITDVEGVLAAPPCTHFTCSGNQYWAVKDADGRTAAAVELVMQVIRVVQYFEPDWWVIENPQGRLVKLITAYCGADILGKPWYFDPFEFAGYADEEFNYRRMSEEPLKSFASKFSSAQRLAFATERYTKRTGLWGEFNIPHKLSLPPVQFCEQGSWLQLLGGKSERTKQLRSTTPTGFSQAFFEVNHG